VRAKPKKGRRNFLGRQSQREERTYLKKKPLRGSWKVKEARLNKCLGKGRECKDRKKKASKLAKKEERETKQRMKEKEESNV